MALLRRYLRSEIAELHRNGVRIRFIGERDRLGRDIVAMIQQAEQQPLSNARPNLTLALRQRRRGHRGDGQHVRPRLRGFRSPR